MAETNEDIWLTLYIIVIFVVFISGPLPGRVNLSSPTQSTRAMACAARRRSKPRRDGKKRSIKLPAVIAALVVVFGVIVLDHFKGPLFPNVFYSPK
jgi:hypothetical protein